MGLWQRSESATTELLNVSGFQHELVVRVRERLVLLTAYNETQESKHYIYGQDWVLTV